MRRTILLLTMLMMACTSEPGPFYSPSGGARADDPGRDDPPAKKDDPAVVPTDGGVTDASDGGATPPPGDQGQGDGKDVVSIGDSYIRLPNQLQQPGAEGVDLSLAKASGRTYRTFAFTGAQLFPPTAVAMKNGVIPGQFNRAKTEDANIKTLVMAGGGNDLPQGGGACKGATKPADLDAECKSLITSINQAIDAFIADVAKAGVKDLVWVGYGATDPAKGLEGAIAALREDRKAKCTVNATPGMRCHFIDNAAAKIPTRDGFHPTAAGYDDIGKAVWERMKKEGMRR